MNFRIETTRWTRSFEMALGSDKQTGYREISFALKPSHLGSPLHLASGGTLLERGNWNIWLSVSEAPPDVPWKGVAALHPASKEESRLLQFSLKLTREEMDECWNAVMRGVVPETVRLDLRQDAPAIVWSKEHKFDKEWQDSEHPHVELSSASFHYDYKLDRAMEQRSPLDLVKRQSGPIIVGLLIAILIADIFRR
jgi:hypothetical protein